jgi:hypothetical protein
MSLPDMSVPDMSAPRSLCVFGDSHIACIKDALVAGYRPAPGWDVAFFGADGPRFRMLRLEGGRIRPDPAALATVRMISGGAEALAPGDHAAVLFTGVRVRALDVFAPRLDRLSRPGGFLSRAASRAEAADWLRRHRFYGYAVAFAAAGAGPVLMSPASFPLAGVGPDPLADWPGARAADADARAAVWADLAAVAAEDGITLLPQPEATVTEGCLTAPDWGRPGAREAGDPVHRNARFGGLVLDAALAALGAVPRVTPGCA